MCQNLVDLNHRPAHTIKAAVLNRFGQTNAEDLQRAANCVDQINGFAQQGLARTQKSPNPMCFPALHVNGAEPTSLQDLSDATGIVPIRLFAHP